MTGWCPQCGNSPDDPCRSCRRAGHLPEYVPPLDIKRHDSLGLGGVPAGNEGVLPAQTAPDQELFFDAVMAETRSSWKQRAELLYVTCRDYWRRLEAQEREHFERLTVTRLALRDLLDFHDKDCLLDHNGFCQAHASGGHGVPCVVAEARKVLDAP